MRVLRVIINGRTLLGSDTNFGGKVNIALHTRNPAKTARFYKEVFGLHELSRTPRDSGEEIVWNSSTVVLSAGYAVFAILKYGSEDAPNLGEGPSTVEGVHHIGFYVDDIDETVDTFKGAGATERLGSLPPSFFKCKGPDGLMIDIAKRGWDEIIKARTKLLHAVPAPAD